jgi:predicted PurR-regulated permease PerM
VPRTLIVVVVYGLLFFILAVLGLVIATQLANSISAFTDELPKLRLQVPEIVQPLQQRLDALGLQVDLEVVIDQSLQEVARSAGDFVGPLQDIAVASLGMLGNLMFMIFLSLFILIDKDGLLAFVNRVTPPRYAPEVRLFQTSVAASFGGFLRGQAVQGLVYASIAAAGSLILNIDYMPFTTALVGIFQFIPFFGPFISWSPPVIAAAFTQPDALVWIIVIMALGWFVTMNLVQPRVMASSVGVHPVVVLVSVLIGLRLQGIVGAIFAIPVAAVISAFFFYYLNRTQGGPRDVTSRAARRLEKLEGRTIRVPTPPSVGMPPGPTPGATSAAGAGSSGPARGASGPSGVGPGPAATPPGTGDPEGASR